MRKFLIFFSSTFVLTAAPFNIIACNVVERESTIKVPDWVYNMTTAENTAIGYDHYWLINKIEDKTDPWQQKDWINLNLNQDLYLYLPEANNIDEAVSDIALNDSANMALVTDIFEPVTWKKVNDTTYTNNQFITQDTTVGGKTLIDSTKFNEIKNSSKAITSWTQAEKDAFNENGSMLPRTQADWWNSNGWEKLLSEEPNLNSIKNPNEKFSERDIYNNWVSKDIIGMNVPLSLMAENSFTLRKTELDHIFLFQSTPRQVWFSNKSTIITIPTPHWGFTLSIFNQEEEFFQTPQLIALKNTFKDQEVNSYLDSKEFFSFNIQEENKFVDSRIS